MDLMGMMGKLQEAQAKVEEARKRMDTVMLQEKSRDDLLTVKITANRELKSIEIDQSLLEDKEQLEDYLIVTLNKAIQNASRVHEEELAKVAKEGLPPIPGLGL